MNDVEHFAAGINECGI